MNIPLLEERLAVNPKSPLFARLASCYLKEGEVQRAVDVCAKGLKEHPDYTTAHLILARCFEAMGRHVEALVEYRRVLTVFPDNPLITNLVHSIEQKEQEAFRTFAEQRLQELRKRQVVDTRTAGGRADEEGDPVDTNPAGQKIVTATLAEIYASQGEFGEAIQIYRKLSEQKPEESGSYLQRVVELENLARIQRAEKDN